MTQKLGSAQRSMRVTGAPALKPALLTCIWLSAALAIGTGSVGCGKDSAESTTQTGGKAGSGGSTSQGGGLGKAGVTGGGSSALGGDASGAACERSECGPGLGVPNHVCDDGSLGGPTGRCVRIDNSTCAWEMRDCPPGGAGAAGAGGSDNDGGLGGASADRCGGCVNAGATPEICIYQAGGPGPSRFVCATQNPCGAPGACACIVGQGTCDNTLMGGGTAGYCVCDNGLE